MTCSKCLCMSMCVNAEQVKSASPSAWPWRGACSELSASGLGLAAPSSLMAGLNARWHRQLVPTDPLALDSVVYCVSVCRHGYAFANASSCCPHTNFPSPTDTPVQKYEVQVGAGIWHINTFFHSLPQSAHHCRLRNICLQRVFKQPLC